tara:strand:- start:1251 stop:1931 length:681 start_codon:yes stop_codon:yes gene_type:complete
MSNEFNLNVDKRELTNKGGRKQALRDGKVPGIYYSHDSKESIPFYISKSELSAAQKADTQIFNISVGDKKRNVLFKSIQYHPVTDEIMHIDLYGIKMDQLVSVNVALNISGNAKGIVEGGILVQNLNEIEIECLPSDIPQLIDVDISSLEIGDSLRCEDIILEEKLNMKTSGDQIVISVTQPAQESETQVESDDSVDGGEDAPDSTGDSTDSENSSGGSDEGSKEE